MSSREERSRLLNEWVSTWTRRSLRNVCKPCWELNYCPYGPFVEEFPLAEITRYEATGHNAILIKQLRKGAYNDDRKKKRMLQHPFIG